MHADDMLSVLKRLKNGTRTAAVDFLTFFFDFFQNKFGIFLVNFFDFFLYKIWDIFGQNFRLFPI